MIMMITGCNPIELSISIWISDLDLKKEKLKSGGMCVV